MNGRHGHPEAKPVPAPGRAPEPGSLHSSDPSPGGSFSRGSESVPELPLSRLFNSSASQWLPAVLAARQLFAPRPSVIAIEGQEDLIVVPHDADPGSGGE
jgi:hypothetical protein